MKVYLFIEALPNKGWAIRPAPFDDPNMSTVPMNLSLCTSALAWLARHEAPHWQKGFDGQYNCSALQERLGYWPEPYEADVQLIMDYEFNDSLECIR